MIQISTILYFWPIERDPKLLFTSVTSKKKIFFWPLQDPLCNFTFFYELWWWWVLSELLLCSRIRRSIFYHFLQVLTWFVAIGNGIEERERRRKNHINHRLVERSHSVYVRTASSQACCLPALLNWFIVHTGLWAIWKEQHAQYTWFLLRLKIS